MHFAEVECQPGDILEYIPDEEEEIKMERTLQEQIEEQDYQLDDLDDLEEQTIFSPLDDAQIKSLKLGLLFSTW